MENLVQYLETLDGDISPVLPQMPLPAGDVMPQIPVPNPEPQASCSGTRKRKRNPTPSPTLQISEDEEEQGDEEEEEREDEDAELVLDGTFSQGQRIGVYYDNKFYVGEVLQVVETGKAEVAFMDQVPGQNIFRWKMEDIDVVEKKFVFMWNVEMTSQNRRSWSVTNFNKLLSSHRKFQETFCQ